MVKVGGIQSLLPAQCTHTHSDVHWTSGGNEESVCLAYTEICLHAVSRDTASFPHPCLYLLTSCVPPGGDEGGEEEGETVEMRLVLENEEKCKSSSLPIKLMFL